MVSERFHNDVLFNDALLFVKSLNQPDSINHPFMCKLSPSSAITSIVEPGFGDVSNPVYENKEPKKRNSRKKVAIRSDQLIKYGIWLYFFLLIFEGALRKWVLPGLATPLLVVRDPVAVIVLLIAIRRNLLPWNIYVVSMIVLGLIATLTALTLGHGVLVVAAFGARALLIHVPLAFVMGRALDRDDVIWFGIITLCIAIPMTGLIFLQFYSPQSAWVNRGVGGDLKGGGFNAGAMGYLRPPGTFSFTNGLTTFFGLVSAFVFYFWLNPRKINRLLLWIATVALLMALPLSISRSLIFQVLICVVFFLAVTASQTRYLPKVLIATIVIGILVFLASLTPAFQKATTVMATRFTMASKHEGGLQGTLVDRFLLGGLVYAISDSTNSTLFGAGIGLGTNVGAKYMTGKFGFLLAEGEWGRIVGEMGSVLGLPLIALRFGLTFQLLVMSIRRLLKGDVLPWMLMSFGFLIILQSGWGQPTLLGFYTLITGFVLASLRRPKRRKKTRDADDRVSDNSADLLVSGVNQK